MSTSRSRGVAATAKSARAATSTPSGVVSKKPSMSPPTSGRRYARRSGTRTTGNVGVSQSIGAVTHAWWRTGNAGTAVPARAAITPDHAPAAITTASAFTSPPRVVTPRARPAATRTPSTSRPVANVTPPRRAAVAYAVASVYGSA